MATAQRSNAPGRTGAGRERSDPDHCSVSWTHGCEIPPAAARFLRAADERSGNALATSPLTSSHALDAWLDAYGRQRPVWIATATLGDDVVSASVWSRRPGDPERRLRLWGDTLDIGALAIAAGAARAVWSEVLRGLAEHADELVLRNLPVVDPLTTALVATADPELLDERALPEADLRGGRDAWWRARSRSQRKQLRRSEARFGALYPSITRHRSPDAVAAATRRLVALHRLRFATLGRDTSMADDDHGEFLVGLATRLATANMASVFEATVDDVPVAAELVVHGRDRWWSLQAGWDPSVADAHPGTGLTLAVIDAACAEGARSYSLLEGTEPYKRRYTSRERRVATWRLDLEPWRGTP